VTVTAPGVTVTNTNATVALVDNFTADFDYAKGSDGSKLQGGLVGGVRANNIKGGSAHGGGVLAIDRTQKLLIDSVTLIDLAADPAATLGDNGIDWKRCTGPTGTLSNSVIQAPLTGMRVRGCTSGGLTVSNNSLNSPGGAGIEFTRDVKGATVTGNTISNNLADGVAVRAANEAISITGNRIQNNGGCGILTAATAKNITTLPNAFLNNAGGDVCIK
jgi:parallel beta-helix repeat protein